MSNQIPTLPGQQAKAKASGRGVGFALMLVWFVLVSSVATQYIAWRLAYHPALGAPWFGHAYAPWSWLPWSLHWYNNATHTFAVAYTGILAGVIAGFLIYVMVVGVRSRSSQRHEGIHGTAHWAGEKEIRTMGLLPKKGERGAGVYVGGWTDPKGQLHYLRHNGPEHVAGIAPTRSGKGVSLVVPTLLSWPASCVVNDQKAELWNLTAGWREEQAGNTCIRFNPAAAPGKSARFNPLQEIRLRSMNEVGDVQNLVTILVDPEGKGLVDHWAKTAHAFLTGVLLHLMYMREKEGRSATLPDIAFALSDPANPIDELYAAMVSNEWDENDLYATTAQLKHPHQHPIVAAAAADMLNRPEEERGSVLSTAMSFLSLYRDPLIAHNVQASDFKIMDLMNAEKPVTLFLMAREEDKDRLKPLMRLMINQLVRVLLRPELTFDENGQSVMPHKHRMLFLLDEFPSYGKLDVFEEALAYIAGYGIKAYLIMQDVEQLYKAYGDNEAITSNCHVRVSFAPNKLRTAEWLSKMTGVTTIIKEDISTSGNRFGAVLGSVSKTLHELQRPLLTADEAMRLKAPEKDSGGKIVSAGDLLVFVAGNAPIYGTQSLYFRDPTFRERAKIKPPAVPIPGGTGVNTPVPQTSMASTGSTPAPAFKIDGQAQTP